ncbi:MULTISPECIES: hypothetical protein [Streptomyces]|uniref:hypothetical protein n=1 Tax=Streptomyces TaxID=1883 RepID=UPI00165FD72E|nr:hypothetical protein [Streptomyces apricus]
MRVRTFLAAGAFAVTAILGSAGSALADEHDESRNEGGFRACGEFAGAGHGDAYYGEGCAAGHWKSENVSHEDDSDDRHDGDNRHEGDGRHEGGNRHDNRHEGHHGGGNLIGDLFGR